MDLRPRGALSRNRHHNRLKGNALNAILAELRVTNDFQEFLQLEVKTERRRLLLFYAEKDLEVILNVEFILADGNFKYNPSEFHSPWQFYTAHAIVKREAHPIVYALMQSCDVQAYEVVFGTLKTSLETKFEGVGGLSTSTTWHFDYESAAIQAVMNVFKTTARFPKVRGCAFHFAKAINTKRDELGLRALCRDDPEVNKRFVRIRHLPFVPDHCHVLFSSDLLAAKPNLPQLNAARLDQFIRYFRNFWLSHSIIREIWGQFGNRGPRTTNVVEGWHNGLHSRLSSRHPDLTEFIQFLQVAQHAAQNRIQALLLDPLAVARPTSSFVSARNERLHAEMDAFASFTSGNAATYQDVCNYVDRIASTGVLPAAT
ncbi:uncharacterized protein LOC121837372 [Ixodes scapularis]|uniref:uncharacterized protein LOC121837372 n=1 Tax=Ixodes scapularis TaxID=6945 RepID=UPI001C392599|nr:uncharacterized protein LOC121837372 [Ixodes scapularis]